MRRSLPLAAVLLICACATDAAPLDIAPTSGDEGRALATTVADEADCDSLEELGSDNEAGLWTFTCQIGERSYAIHTARNKPALRRFMDQIDRNAFVRANYAVVQAIGEGSPVGAESYEAFDTPTAQ